jgi:hypothetical protein
MLTQEGISSQNIIRKKVGKLLMHLDMEAANSIFYNENE